MVKLNLKINARTEVIYDEILYKSVIQDIKEDEIIISLPVIDGVYLTIATGEEIEQYYYDPNNNNIYQYKTKVIGRISENGIPFYRLSMPYSIEKVQRRDNVRVNILNEISYIKVKNIEDTIPKKGLILDLSGGGSKIKVKDKLEKDDIILINLSLEGVNLSIKGKIIRSIVTEDKNYSCGVKFFDLSEVMKEEIIKLVFRVMRKQRELL